MSSQPPSPNWMGMLLVAALLRMGYELSRPDPSNRKEEGVLLPDTTPEWAGLPPWQRKASEKAIERYAAVQERKWRRWNEAMFERS